MVGARSAPYPAVQLTGIGIEMMSTRLHLTSCPVRLTFRLHALLRPQSHTPTKALRAMAGVNGLHWADLGNLRQPCRTHGTGGDEVMLPPEIGCPRCAFLFKTASVFCALPALTRCPVCGLTVDELRSLVETPRPQARLESDLLRLEQVPLQRPSGSLEAHLGDAMPSEPDTSPRRLAAEKTHSIGPRSRGDVLVRGVATRTRAS